MADPIFTSATIDVQLDTVNKKQARFVANETRDIVHLATYHQNQDRIEELPSASVYLDREVWIAWGSPSYLKVSLNDEPTNPS